VAVAAVVVVVVVMVVVVVALAATAAHLQDHRGVTWIACSTRSAMRLPLGCLG